MMNRKLPIVSSVLLATLLAGACAQTETGRSKSLVGASDLRFLTQLDRGAMPLAEAVGSLSELEISEETPEFSEIYSICTGVQISPRLVLTAAHCKTPVGYVFDRQNLVSTEDKDKLKFKTFGRLVRLMFSGDLVPESREALAYKPSPSALYTSAELDFAIWTFDQLPQESFIDLKAYSENTSDLALYGYPNGAPLTLAENCSGRIQTTRETGKDKAQNILHDCDSLNGSSGGLLWDKSSGLPVGLHVKGSGANDGEFYKANGQFETVEELAKICDSAECAGAEGMNQAIAISAILEDIVNHSPELASELKLLETPCDSQSQSVP